MAHFEVDLPVAEAGQFDKLLSRFVATELGGANEIDVRATACSIDVGIERRHIFISSPAFLDAFVRQWTDARTRLLTHKVQVRGRLAAARARSLRLEAGFA